MQTTFSIPTVVAALISVSAVTTGLLSGGVAAATTPVEADAAQTFCGTVNAERSARGLARLRCTYGGGAQAAAESHTDSTAVWIPYATNPAAATIAFMQSADHRWWLMDPTATVIDIDVACVDFRTGDGWTQHLMDVAANLPDAHGPDGAPAPGYVTRPDSSTPCGPPTPPPTPSTTRPTPTGGTPTPATPPMTQPPVPGEQSDPRQTRPADTPQALPRVMPAPRRPGTTTSATHRDHTSAASSSSTTSPSGDTSRFSRTRDEAPVSGTAANTLAPRTADTSESKAPSRSAWVPAGGIGLLASVALALLARHLRRARRQAEA